MIKQNTVFKNLHEELKRKDAESLQVWKASFNYQIYHLMTTRGIGISILSFFLDWKVVYIYNKE